MMPNTSVRPAASRNSIRPSCRPFSSCSTIRDGGKGSLHLALRGGDVLEVGERLADGLVGDAAASVLVDLAQVVVLDREVVLVEAEFSARRVEFGFGERLAQRLLVLDLAADLLDRGIDQQRHVVG